MARSLRLGWISPLAALDEQLARPTDLVAEKLGDAGIQLLKTFANVDCSYNLSPEELCTKISLCDALIVRNETKVTREVFESSMGRLKVVGRACVGTDNVIYRLLPNMDVSSLTRRLPIQLPQLKMGLLCLLLWPGMLPRLLLLNWIRPGKWERNKYVGVSLVGKTLAEMGFGKVGSELVTIEEALVTADFISMHMPLTPATSKMFNDDAFSRVKKGVSLDVFTEEPPLPENKLVRHEYVTATPHLGASTTEAQEGVALEIAEAVVGALKGDLAATISKFVLLELSPYVALTEKLGRLAVQLVAGGSGVKFVKATYASARGPDDLDTRLLRAMITKGLIEPISSIFVNLVNADFITKQRGLRLTEERIELDEGTVKDRKPHLSKVGSFGVDVSLEGSIILCRQADQPGIIGIAPGKQSVMAIGVDEEPSRDALKKIGEFHLWNSSVPKVVTLLDNNLNGLVDLNARMCSCMKWQTSGYPCGHVIKVALHLNQDDSSTYAMDCYTTEVYRQTYAEIVYPISHPSEWDIPDDLQTVLPPAMDRRLPGRPKSHDRIPSKGEEKKRSTCSRCKESGHTRLTCGSPVPSQSSFPLPKYGSSSKSKAHMVSRKRQSKSQSSLKSQSQLASPFGTVNLGNHLNIHRNAETTIAMRNENRNERIAMRNENRNANFAMRNENRNGGIAMRNENRNANLISRCDFHFRVAIFISHCDSTFCLQHNAD
ncbi:D-3-phosphoglycerate dehydrogenase 1 [Hibiscus syriacus]|uniref:phosphoglycerate dehydrogenase n=1 Tax=Hibiscus syriacus TaxID=106335 RepID=A0A6A2ZVB4_HIBSY|nr:D-3-phosphoglycerate dehydrogenase 1 [Hibiscus syriacus]